MFKNTSFNWWMGVVEDRKDPEKLGRVRVRILGVHSENRSVLPTEDLPWAVVMQPTTSAAVSGLGSAPVGLMQGTWCVGFFIDGEDMQQPIVMGTIGAKPSVNTNAASQLRSETSNPPNVLRDSQGNPVVDSSGNPIISGSGEETNLSEFPPLTTVQLQRLLDEIGFKESSSRGNSQNYSAANDYGYIGKYQFGAQALATLGYVKVGVNQKLTNSSLDIDSNWTGKSGLNSKDAFFRNGQVQENIMIENLRFNFNILKKNGTINSNDDPGKVAGLLSVAHLLGAGGATNYANGRDKKDGNGTSGSTYYSLGASAVGETIPNANNPSPGIASNKNPAGSLNDMGALAAKPFSDPNKEYPKKDYANYPDTNKLAIGVYEKTAIEKRMKSTRTDIETVKGDPWDEPSPAYGAKYPFNQTFETEAGHLVEFDNTPGQERIHVYHKKGSFIEIDVNGSSVRKVVGDNYEILERNNYVYVRGAYKMTVEGATQILVKNDVDLQIHGTTNATINGNFSTKVAGDVNITAGGNYNVRAKSFNLFTLGDFNSSIAGDFNFSTTGGYNVLSAQGIAMDGTTFHTNSGRALVAAAKTAAAQAMAAVGLGLAPDPLLIDRTSTTPLKRPEPSGSPFDLDADDPGAKEKRDKLLASGDIVDTVPQENGEAAPEAPTTPVIPCDCNEFEGVTNFPDGLQLSKYYNLGDLSSRAAAVQETVIAQRGLTKPQIICNLKNLAVNCLDMIKEKYPDMIVTNAFRLDNSSGKNISDHGTGMAADLQFTSASTSDYFEIVKWITSNVQHKQVLLEYGGGARNPWIHIAFDKTGSKHPMRIGTLKDHSVYSNNKFINLG